MKDPITIYRFEDAPKELQNLSQNGGDEDWLAIVPKHLKKECKKKSPYHFLVRQTNHNPRWRPGGICTGHHQ